MDDPQPTGGDRVGTLGEEAVKLLSAVSSWAQDHAGADEQTTTPTGTCTGAAGSACQWCPLCRAVSSARAVSPELREQLVVAGLALTAAARTFLESLTAPSARSNPSTGVEHLDLRDDDGGAQPWD